MDVKATFVANNKNINKLQQIQETALKMTADALLTEIVAMAVVPKDKGILERSGFVDESQLNGLVASIVFDTPYARRLYWNPQFNFRKDKNANAQGKWMEMFVTGERKDFVKETYAKFLRQLSKGLIK